MAANSPTERALIARAAAHARWAKTEDRRAASEPGRRAAEDRFERQVDPDGVLPPEERAKRAASARKAFYARLALASVRARRARSAA
jgi:hypothetical protein